MRRVQTLAVALASLGSVTACTRLPDGKTSIDAVEIEGTDLSADAAEKIATRPTARFLMVFKGIFYEYEVYDRYVVERDLLRIERFLKARGYYDARARAAEAIPLGANRVKVRIEVEQGQPVTVARVDIEGADALPPATMREVLHAARASLREGTLFDEERFETATGRLLRTLTDRGFARARVTHTAAVDLSRHTADLKFVVDAGSPCRFGAITFEGLEQDVPEGPLREVIGFKQGDAYSTDDMNTAQQALLDLGVFVAADVDADTRGGRTDIPVVVRVEIGKLRSVLLGGGIEFDTSRADVHLQAGWSHANFFGGLKNFEVKAQPGLVFYPLRTNNVVRPESYLPTFQSRAVLKRPAFIEARTTGLVEARVRVLPELRPLGDGQSDANVPGYTELGLSPGLVRSFGRFFVNPQYSASYYLPFNYIGVVPVSLSPLLVSYIDLFAYLDLRNDPVRTKRGFYFGNSIQFAGGFLQGGADDVRVQPDVRGYVPLSRRVTIASRGAVGFLFPRNYGRLARENAKDAPIAESAQRSLARDYQIYYVRSFFSGGASSNRGYPYNGVSPYAIVPYLNPSQVATSACAFSLRSTDRNDACKVPTGGLSLWEASIEPRFEIRGPLSAVTFCDASDVSPETLNLRFDRPHLSCGTGVRYDTPVGPLRLDVAYRIPGLQVPGQSDGDGDPGTIFGAPLGIAFGIGEAF